MKIRQFINECLNEVLDEMARVPRLVTVADEEKLNQIKQEYDGTWIAQMLQYIQDNPQGVTVEDITQHVGKKRVQMVNGNLVKLIAAGAVNRGDYVTPLKKVKSDEPKQQGRHLTKPEDTSKENIVKHIIAKIKNSEEPREEYSSWFKSNYSEDDYNSLVSLVKQYTETHTREEANEVMDKTYKLLKGLGFEVQGRGRPVGSAAKPKSLDDIPPIDSQMV